MQIQVLPKSTKKELYATTTPFTFITLRPEARTLQRKAPLKMSSTATLQVQPGSLGASQETRLGAKGPLMINLIGIDPFKFRVQG